MHTVAKPVTKQTAPKGKTRTDHAPTVSSSKPQNYIPTHTWDVDKNWINQVKRHGLPTAGHAGLEYYEHRGKK